MTSSREALYDHGARRAGTDTYHTPAWFAHEIPALLGKHYLDPCPGIFSWWTGASEKVNWPMESGLEVPWAQVNFLNPPFSELLLWLKKAISERDRGASTLYFGKLDFRTAWGRLLAAEASLLYPTLGYVRYHKPYQDVGSASFQSCVAVLSNDSGFTTTTDLILRDLFPDRFYFGAQK